MKRILFFLMVLIGTFAQSQPPCYIPTGSLSWTNPDDFDTSTDIILIFAKKVPLKFIKNHNIDSVLNPFISIPTYINIESPVKDPATYDAPDTNLLVLEGVVPVGLQYENDPLAMLIYRDTGNCVEFSGMEDSTYFYAAFNVSSGVYSNSQYARGKTIAVERVFTIVMANSVRAQWRKSLFLSLDTVIVVYSTDSVIIAPTGYASNYLPGLSKNYNASTSYLNGVNDSQGKILYNSIGDRVQVSNLPVGKIWINIFTNQDSCWSKPVRRLFDTR